MGKNASSFGKHFDNLTSIGILIDEIKEGRLRKIQDLAVEKRFDKVHKAVQSRQVGFFLSGQVLLDLCYAKVVDMTNDSYLILGPGALWNMRILFGEHTPWVQQVKNQQWLRDTQLEHFLQLKNDTGKDWNDVAPKDLIFPLPYNQISVMDMQNASCEARKFVNITRSHNEVGFKCRRRKFYPNERGL
jgi:hypothetical protein